MRTKKLLQFIVICITLFTIAPTNVFAGFSGGKVYHADHFTVAGSNFPTLQWGGSINISSLAAKAEGALAIDFPVETTTDKIMNVSLVAADETIDNCYADYKSWAVEYRFELPRTADWFVDGVSLSGTSISIGGLRFDSIMGNQVFPDLTDGEYRLVVMAESRDSIQSGPYKYPAIDVIYSNPFYITGTGNTLPTGATHFSAIVKKEYAGGNGFSEPIDHFSPYMTEQLYVTTGFEFNYGQHIDSIGLLPAYTTPTPENIKSAIFLKTGWLEGHWSNVSISQLELKTDDASFKIEGGAYRFVIKSSRDDYYYSQVFVINYPAEPQIDKIYESPVFEVTEEATSVGSIYIGPNSNINATSLSGETSGYLHGFRWNDNTTANVVSVALVSESDPIDECYFQKQYYIENALQLPLSQTTGFIDGVSTNGDNVLGIGNIRLDGFSGLSGSYRFVIIAESKTARKVDGYDAPFYNLIYTSSFTIISGNTPPTGMTPFEAVLRGNDPAPVCHIPYPANETFDLKVNSTAINFNPQSLKLMDAGYSLNVGSVNYATSLGYSSISTSGNLTISGISFNPDLIYPGVYRFILKKGENDYYYSQIFVIEDVAHKEENINLTDETTENSALISWNKVEEAVGYTLTVYTDKAQTQLFGSYAFDADGVKLSNDLSFRSALKSTTAGSLAYTVQGLTANTHYYYTLGVLGENATIINEYTSDFVTQNLTNIPSITNDKLRITVVGDELRIENYEGNGNVQIFDIVGARFIAPVNNGAQTINVSHLSSGVYIVRVGNQSAKFIKK